MKYLWKVMAMGILGLLAGCSGNDGAQVSQSGIELRPLNGTSAAALVLSEQNGRTVVKLPDLGESGAFFSLQFPAGMAPQDIRWLDDADQPVSSGLLTISHFEGGELQTGVLALEGSAGAVFRMDFVCAPDLNIRLASVTEAEIREEVVNGLVSQYDPLGRMLLLSWPAWTPGDYDLSGIVGIHDITPLGQHFGSDNGSGQAWSQDDPLCWVDGNGDGVLNASDLSAIGQHFNDELLGFRLYLDGSPYNGLDETVLNPLHGDTQGPGLPRRHFLPLPELESAENLELRALLQRHRSGTAGGNPDLEVSIRIDGIELIDNGDGLKAGTRVIKPIEDIAGYREIIATPEKEDSESSTFKSIPRGSDLLLDIYYSPAFSPVTGTPLTDPGDKSTSALVTTAVPFHLPELHGTTYMSVDIHYLPQGDGSYYAQLDAAIDYGNGILEYSALLDYAGALVQRDSDADGSFLDELKFPDSDLDCISDNYASELHGGSNVTPTGNILVHGVFDGPLESVDFANTTLVMAEESQQSWSDGVERTDRTVVFSENAVFGGFPNFYTLQPGTYVHIELLRLEDVSGSEPAKNWAEFIHALDQNFNEYWVQANLSPNSEVVAINAGKGGTALDNSYAEYHIGIRDLNTGETQDILLGEVGTGFLYVAFWPDHFYTISLYGFDDVEYRLVLLADIDFYMDPEQFWDGFGDPPEGPIGGPGV